MINDKKQLCIAKICVLLDKSKSKDIEICLSTLSYEQLIFLEEAIDKQIDAEKELAEDRGWKKAKDDYEY